MVPRTKVGVAIISVATIVVDLSIAPGRLAESVPSDDTDDREQDRGVRDQQGRRHEPGRDEVGDVLVQ